MTNIKSLAQELPARIARLEAKYGSQDRYVQQLKQQLQAMNANKGKSAFQIYATGAIPNPDPPTAPPPTSERPNSETSLDNSDVIEWAIKAYPGLTRERAQELLEALGY